MNRTTGQRSRQPQGTPIGGRFAPEHDGGPATSLEVDGAEQYTGEDDPAADIPLSEISSTLRPYGWHNVFTERGFSGELWVPPFQDDSPDALWVGVLDPWTPDYVEQIRFETDGAPLTNAQADRAIRYVKECAQNSYDDGLICAADPGEWDNDTVIFTVKNAVASVRANPGETPERDERGYYLKEENRGDLVLEQPPLAQPHIPDNPLENLGSHGAEYLGDGPLGIITQRQIDNDVESYQPYQPGWEVTNTEIIDDWDTKDMGDHIEARVGPNILTITRDETGLAHATSTDGFTASGYDAQYLARQWSETDIPTPKSIRNKAIRQALKDGKIPAATAKRAIESVVMHYADATGQLEIRAAAELGVPAMEGEYGVLYYPDSWQDAIKFADNMFPASVETVGFTEDQRQYVCDVDWVE